MKKSNLIEAHHCTCNDTRTSYTKRKIILAVLSVLLLFIISFTASIAHAFYVSIKGDILAGRIFPEPPDYQVFDTGQLQQLFVSHNATAITNSAYGSTTTTFEAVAQPGKLSAFASGDVRAFGGPTGTTQVQGGPEWSDTITIVTGGTFNLTTTLTSQVMGGPCKGLSNDGMDCSQTSAKLLTTFYITGFQPFIDTHIDWLGDGNQLQQVFTATTQLTFMAGDQIEVTQRLLVPLLGFSENDVSVSASVDALNTGIFTLDPVTPGATYTSESGVNYVPSICCTIITTAGTGGVISPSGTISVNPGNNQTFTIIPDKGYEIADVTVDDISEGQITNYTFTNVTNDHTIAATFTMKKSLNLSSILLLLDQ